MSVKVEPRYDDTGRLIGQYDVLVNVDTEEVVLVIDGWNELGVQGLAVENQLVGIIDWLDVYPDGTFHIVGNAETAYDD